MVLQNVEQTALSGIRDAAASVRAKWIFRNLCERQRVGGVRSGDNRLDRLATTRPSATRTLAKVAHLDGVEHAAPASSGKSDRDVRSCASGLEHAREDRTILGGVTLQTDRPLPADGDIHAGRPIVVRQYLDQVAVPGRQSLERQRCAVLVLAPHPCVREHLPEIARSALRTRIAVRCVERRRDRCVCGLETGVRCELDSVDRHRRDGIGVEECPVRPENGPFRIRSRAGPASLDGISATAATSACLLHDGIVGVGERLVARESEDDRVAAHDLVALGRGEVNCYLRVRHDRVAPAGRHDRDAVRRNGIKGKPRLCGNRQLADQRHWLGIDRIFATAAALAKVSHLYGVEHAAPTRAGKSNLDVRSRASGLEHAREDRTILGGVTLQTDRPLPADGDIHAGRPIVVRQYLDQVAVPGRQSLERQRCAVLVLTPHPCVRKHLPKVARCVLRTRIAVRCVERRRDRCVFGLEIGVRGERYAVDCHGLDGIGVEECPIRAEKAPVGRRGRAGPAGLDGITATAAATARCLHGGIVCVGERLVAREGEDDRIAARNLVALGCGERHRDLRIRDNRVAPAGRRHHDAVRRHRLKNNPRLCGDCQRTCRLRIGIDVHWIISAARFSVRNLADLNGVERHLAASALIGDRHVLRRADGREDARDERAVLSALSIVAVDVHWVAPVSGDDRSIVKKVVRQELDEVLLPAFEIRERQRDRARARTVAVPVPAVAEGETEVAADAFVQEVAGEAVDVGREGNLRRIIRGLEVYRPLERDAIDGPAVAHVTVYEGALSAEGVSGRVHQCRSPDVGDGGRVDIEDDGLGLRPALVRSHRHLAGVVAVRKTSKCERAVRRLVGKRRHGIRRAVELVGDGILGRGNRIGVRAQDHARERNRRGRSAWRRGELRDARILRTVVRRAVLREQPNEPVVRRARRDVVGPGIARRPGIVGVVLKLLEDHVRSERPECRDDALGLFDGNGRVASVVDGQDRDVRDVGRTGGIAAAATRHRRGEEVGTAADRVPCAVPAHREPGDIDAVGVDIRHRGVGVEEIENSHESRGRLVHERAGCRIHGEIRPLDVVRTLRDEKLVAARNARAVEIALDVRHLVDRERIVDAALTVSVKKNDDWNLATVRVGLRRDAVGEVKLVGRDECLLDEFARQFFATAGFATAGFTTARLTAARLSATAFSPALSELAELDGLDLELAAGSGEVDDDILRGAGCLEHAGDDGAVLVVVAVVCGDWGDVAGGNSYAAAVVEVAGHYLDEILASGRKPLELEGNVRRRSGHVPPPIGVDDAVVDAQSPSFASGLRRRSLERRVRRIGARRERHPAGRVAAFRDREDLRAVAADRGAVGRHRGDLPADRVGLGVDLELHALRGRYHSVACLHHHRAGMPAVGEIRERERRRCAGLARKDRRLGVRIELGDD